MRFAWALSAVPGTVLSAWDTLVTGADRVPTSRQ